MTTCVCGSSTLFSDFRLSEIVPRQIIGIALVRNEDLYLTQVINNVAEFCDQIIILDNCSNDNTPQLISCLMSRFSHIQTYKINDYRDSHEYISSYAGTDTWAFGIDGDELYDPRGLAIFRTELLAGKYDQNWSIFGNVLNCVELDLFKGIAKGYLSPPSRSMTKLFNFGALESWSGSCERFHGGEKKFVSGYDETKRLSLHEVTSWDTASFRCLHLCFIRRSSLERGKNLSRLQPGERANWLKQLDRLGLGRLSSVIRKEKRSPWKDEKYRLGEITVIDTTPFFSDNIR